MMMTACGYEALLERRYTAGVKAIAKALGIRAAGLGKSDLIATIAQELATGRHSDIVAQYRLGSTR